MRAHGRRGNRGLGRVGALAALLLGGAWLAARPQSAAPDYTAFATPERVTIRGYSADAMEPFVSRDGRYLLFNNRNDPKVNTNLHWAERVDDLTFQYRGEIEGVNTAALEGVPSMDRAGWLYFVSTRSYPQTLSTVYRGKFAAGKVTGVELVPGLSRKQPGWVNFDVEISPESRTLYTVDGRFEPGSPNPKSAALVVARRNGAGFERLPNSADILRNVNTGALQYAACVSRDGLELFFTRLDTSGPAPSFATYRTARTRPDAPFGVPRRVAAITGFAEAPTLSPDERSLYYHKLDGGRFGIWRVRRQGTAR